MVRRVHLALLAALLCSACASHLIRSAEAEGVGVAGQPFRHGSVSIAGRSGASSDGAGYVTRESCRTGDLAQVEMRRNVGQTLVTILTLGIVSPVTFHYYCEAPEVPPPCDCPQGDDEL